MANRRRRNVVLLSDGTGNSSAKLMKTNVWRLYEAIDTSSGDQVALYDNGVGTSTFKPFAILGGGLGWGLKRNVRTLYMFACRHYAHDPDPAEADRIFAFGFSRGAFTIRVLIGLIESQGLIQGVQGRELKRRAKWAYREYRRQFNEGTWLVRRLRELRDWLLIHIVERRPPYTAEGNVRPRVHFVGLWDTVDAYGLPIDEMTRGWDQWVWPLTLSRHRHPPVVDKLCHAVALDDERHTFHPLLLDESTEPARTHTDEERLTQVWFAGVHSNVGGGYPDDSLAYVPLRWMASEACKKDLRLHAHVEAEWKARADPNGPANDSRHGLGAYYRYNPRRISHLTNDRFAEIDVPLPKIHHSVFARIGAGRDEYAPIVLPERYAVVQEDGRIDTAPSSPYEHETQSRSRCADQERGWNLVWARRLAYFSTVILTFVLVVLPFLEVPLGTLGRESNGLSGLVRLIGNFLPGLAAPWIDYYAEYPLPLVLGGSVVALLLFVVSPYLQAAIHDRMREVWEPIVRRPNAPVTPAPLPRDAIYRLRSSLLYRGFFQVATQYVFPFVFGVGCLLALVVIAAGTLNRASFAIASAAGWTCPEPAAGAARPAWNGGPFTVELPSREVCQSTGLELRAGQTYTVDIELPDTWSDCSLPVATPAGLSTGSHPLLFVPALPFRRVLTARWFVPMVRVGAFGAEYHQLDQGVVTFTPRRDGHLYLFVNDAIGVGPWLKYFYDNNLGTAAVTITAGDRETARRLAAGAPRHVRRSVPLTSEDTSCAVPPGA